MNWALEGCKQWRQQGLTPPSEVLAAVESYKGEMDLIGTWLEECCVQTPGAEAKAKELYDSYRRWTEENGGRPLSNTRFGTKMMERGFHKRKSGGFIYQGVGILADREGWDGWESGSTSSSKRIEEMVF